MAHEIEIRGRIAHVRKLGGITFLVIDEVPGRSLTIVCDRSQMDLQDYAKIQEFRPSDRCRIMVTPRGDDLGATRLLKHYRFRGCWKVAEEQLGIVRAYACLLNAVRSFFHRQGYLEVRLPTIHFGGTKGDMFSLNFFGSPARLSSSNALFADAYALQLGPVYSIQRCFRSEKSRTRKHLAEFDMLEVAIPDADMEVGMSMLENLIKHIVHELEHSQYSSLLRFGGTLAEQFRRESYDAIASRLGIIGRGLGKWEASVASNGPLFVVEYPPNLASWTAEKIDAQHTASFNLLLPDVGEVAEGTQRSHDVEQARLKFRALGLTRQLGWYANAMVYPGCRSIGFGVGLERLAMWLFGLQNIRKVQLIYRDTSFSEIPSDNVRKGS